MSIPTATLQIAISAFRPTGSVFPISATLSLVAGDPGNFSFNGQTLVITLPSSQNVQLIYQLPDPRYVLLGLAFNPVQGGVGRVEFPTITLNRNPSCSQMFVTDAALPQLSGVDYSYVILVQEAATGAMGVIDPYIETDIEN